jgi:putative transposase
MSHGHGGIELHRELHHAVPSNHWLRHGRYDQSAERVVHGWDGAGVDREPVTDETALTTGEIPNHPALTGMPREARVVAVGVAHHITQRGNARQEIFTTDSMRSAYLRLLSEHAASHRLRVLAYCIMTNHVHVVAIPDSEASMANTFRHAHGRFSQYWNTERRRTGHVWQNRYYSCPVEEAAAGRVIAYVEENPVRAGMVERAEDFLWSSAGSHTGTTEREPWLDSAWFAARWTSEDWRTVLASRTPNEDLRSIREATYLGRPLGSKSFIAELETKLGRRLEARPGGRPKRILDTDANQLALWSVE